VAEDSVPLRYAVLKLNDWRRSKQVLDHGSMKRPSYLMREGLLLSISIGSKEGIGGGFMDSGPSDHISKHQCINLSVHVKAGGLQAKKEE